MKAKFLVLLALVLGVVSCQTEPEGLDVNVGGEIDAIVNVTIPEAETRATNSGIGVFNNGILGDATDNTTMRYILQVYYKTMENGVEKYKPSTERKVEYSDGKSVAFEVRLVPDRDYKFVVWADVVADGKNDTDNHYDTSNLEEITLIGNWNAMDESRDAFTATELIEDYNGAMSIDMSLYRPFAKLRVVTTDMEALSNIKITPSKATATYTTSHRVAFNALTGKAANASLEAKTHTYTITTYANEWDNNVSKGTMTIFSDYFFAESDIVKFNLDVYDQNDDLIKSNAFQTDINVQRNYLTTIKGNILTDGKGFQVTIEDTFVNAGGTNPDYETNIITSAYEVLVAMANGGEIILGSNIVITTGDLAYYAQTRATGGNTTTINLNGFTLKFDDNTKVEIPSNNTLIIKDESENQAGKIEVGNNAGIDNSGNITIEGGNIEEGAIENNGGDVEIQGGNLENGAIQNNSGDVIITGNDIDNNVVNGEVTNYYAGLVQAFANGGEYTLGASVALEQPLALANGKELKLTINEGVVLSIVDNTNKNFELIKNQGNLTVEGSGKLTVKATINRGWNSYSAVIANTVGGNLTVTGVTLEHLGGTDMAYGIDNLTNGKGSSAVATIGDGVKVKSPYRAIRQFLNGVEANNSLTVNAGAVIEGANKSIWMQDPSANANTGTLVVNEGATLNGDVYLYVTAGSTEWPVEVSIAASAVNGEILTGNVPAAYKLELDHGAYVIRHYTTVEGIAALEAALANGGNAIMGGDITAKASDTKANSGYGATGLMVADGAVLDGADHTLTITEANATWDCAIAATNGTIKNLTVAGAMRGIFMPGATGDVFIDNVIFKNVIYTFNSDAGNKNYGVYISNSTLNGWTSHSDVHKEVVYTNCSFGEGSSYKFCRPYGPTKFVNCDFCEGYTIDPKGQIQLINCTINGVALTNENLSTLVSNVNNAKITDVDGNTIVSTADELVAALEANEDVTFANDITIDPASMSNAYGKTGINVKNGQTINGNGHTLNINGAGGTWDSGINTTGGLIKNLTVTGSFRGIFINHNSSYSEKVVLENVTITGTTYTISCDQGMNQGIEATNCTFNGWTSYAKTAGEAKFVNCSFGEGSGYKYCRPYSNTEFVNCTFCPGYTVDTTRATVTYTGCTWE